MASTGYSLTAFNQLRQKAARIQAASARVREKAGETVETIVRTAEVSGAAFLFGLGNMYFAAEKDGKLLPPSMMGVPIDLLGGALAHVGAFMGVGGKAEDHLRALGDGALAVYFASLGRGVGYKAKKDGWASLANKTLREGGSGVPHRLAGASGAPQTIEDIAKIADF
jgi:hypothetical protein